MSTGSRHGIGIPHAATERVDRVQAVRSIARVLSADATRRRLREAGAPEDVLTIFRAEAA